MKRRNFILIIASSFLVLSPLFFSPEWGQLFLRSRMSESEKPVYVDLKELDVSEEEQPEFLPSLGAITKKAVEEKK